MVIGVLTIIRPWPGNLLLNKIGAAARVSRRQFLAGVGSLPGITGVATWLASASPARIKSALAGKVNRRSFLIAAGSALGMAIAASAGWAATFRPHEPSVPAVDLDNLSSLNQRGPFDVCIIGSGPAGTVLGLDLVSRGLRTVILESGTERDRQTLPPATGLLDVYRSSGPIDYPVSSTRIRGIGGTSHIWTGRSPRLHPIDFERNAYTPPGASWPITYNEIESYYEQAEKTLRVRGEGLSEFHAPRESNLPLPAYWHNAGLKATLGDVGIVLDDSPTSSGSSGPGPIRVARDLLPAFIESPFATFFPGATVTRLVSGPDGKITGAEAQTTDGQRTIVPAQTYVIACGALESIRLLLLSKSAAFPAGIGNRNGLVGRYFMEHPNVVLSGTIANPDLDSIARSHQFYVDFKRQGLGSVVLSFRASDTESSEIKRLTIGATVEMAPSADNRVTLASDLVDHFGNPGVDVFLSFTDQDQSTMDAARSLIRRIYADLGVEDVREREIVWSHHHLGGCRMGQDPGTSVTNANLRVHESPNLYLAGSSVFVTGGASHPTLAIVALSHRLADHLTEELKTSNQSIRTASRTFSLAR